jgi:glycosyltransferase involved in cell wall biosynthesis
MAREKIAFLDEGKGIGGAEKNLITFLEHLNKNKFEPLAILSDKGKFSATLNAIGIKTVIIKIPSFYSTSLEFNGIRIPNPCAIIYDTLIILLKSIKLNYYLSHNNISILQTNGMFEHIYGGIAAKMSGVPCVWYMQDIPKGFLCKLKRFALNILAFILPKKVIAVSYAVEEVFYKGIKKKTNVIHVGIDLTKHKVKSAEEIAQIKAKRNLSYAECVVGMIGRLVYWKGHINFIRAAKIVSEKFSKAKFIIVGGGIFGKEIYLQNLKKIIRQLGLEEKFIFTGFMEDITGVLSIMDIFVQCSLYPDPCPITVLEAAALKKSIIASRTGGIPEIIEHGKEGILVEPGNYQVLALEIINLINSPKQRELLKERAYIKIKSKFDVKQEVQKFEEIYLLC